MSVSAKQKKNISLLIGLVLIAGTYRLTEMANQGMARLTVDAIPQKHQQVQPLDTKNLYPVVIRQKRVAAEQKDGKEFDADAAFVGRSLDAPAAPPPPPPNFEAMFREGIILDAITPLGAFVRGVYYPINTPMEEFTISNGVVSITPRIVATRANAIDIRYGKNGFLTIRLNEADRK